MRLVSTIAPCLAFLATVAACGDQTRDQPPAPAVSKAAYITRADRACRTERERVRGVLAREQRRLARDGDLTIADVTELNAAALRAGRPLIARIAALPRPREDLPLLERYLALNRDSLAVNEELVRVGRTGDRRGATRVARRTALIAGQIAATARAYGFRQCGSEFDR